jgi:hypothetical protein
MRLEAPSIDRSFLGNSVIQAALFSFPQSAIRIPQSACDHALRFPAPNATQPWKPAWPIPNRLPLAIALNAPSDNLRSSGPTGTVKFRRGTDFYSFFIAEANASGHGHRIAKVVV